MREKPSRGQTTRKASDNRVVSGSRTKERASRIASRAFSMLSGPRKVTISPLCETRATLPARLDGLWAGCSARSLAPEAGG